MIKHPLLFLLCLLSGIAFGQTKGDLEVGFGFGLNGATLTTQDMTDNPDSNSSVNLHASADYNFSNRMSVKGKIIYDNKGWDDGNLFFRGGRLRNADVDLHYITVPLMLNWHFGGKRNWYFNFGMYSAFLLAAGEETFDADIKEAFKPTDFGFTLGIGAKIPVTKYLKIYIEYDFQNSFNSIYRDSNIPQSQNVRNALNVGVNFLVL